MSDQGQVVWLIEAVFRNKSTDTLVTKYWSSAPIIAFPPSDPDRPNQNYDAVVKEPGTYGRYLYQKGTIDDTEARADDSGPTIFNSNGEFNTLRTEYAADGREMRIYRGYQSYENFGDYELFFTGSMKKLFFSIEKGQVPLIETELSDKSENLRTPFQTTRYLGTNIGAAGVEGLPGDIAGQPKERAYGRLFNVPVTPVNSQSLTYSLNGGGPIDSVQEIRDNGAKLTGGTTDYASLTTLLLASITASQWATCLAQGYVRLGSSPAGQITADYYGDKTGGSFVYTAGDIIKRILTEKGYTSSNYNTTDFTGLTSTVVGAYVNEETTTADVISQVANSIGAAWYHDRTGVFRIKMLDNPDSGTPIYTIKEQAIVNISRIQPRGDIGAFVSYRTILGYKKNYTVQEGDGLAGATTAATRQEIRQEYRRAPSATDSAVQADHLLSKEYTKDTLIWDPTQAATEATRLQAIFGTMRDFLQVEVDYDDEVAALDLMDLIEIESSRAGYPNGKNAYIIGISENDSRPGRRTLELFL